MSREQVCWQWVVYTLSKHAGKLGSSESLGNPMQELPPEHRYPMRKYAQAHQQLRGDASLHNAINFQPVSPALVDVCA
jgi:hypothetical protein